MDTFEVLRLRNICNLDFTDEDLQQWILKEKVLESHFLNKELMERDLNTPFAQEVIKRMHPGLEEFLGYDGIRQIVGIT